jgi:PRTRC genetic system protein E
MFKELAALLRKGDTILGTIALIDDADPAHPRFRLTVHPKLADLGDLASKVLGKPFAIEGTADELDVELPANLTGFATTTNSQRDVFAQLEADSKAAIEEARKAAEESRKKAAAEAKTKPATPAAKPTAKPAKPAAGKPAAPAAGKPAAAKPTTPAPQPAGKPGTPTPTPLANTNLPAASTDTPPKIDIDIF